MGVVTGYHTINDLRSIDRHLGIVGSCLRPVAGVTRLYCPSDSVARSTREILTSQPSGTRFSKSSKS